LHPPFAVRFGAAPGLTGLAQVCLAQGVTLTAQLDTTYVRTRSAALDLKILLRTTWMNLVGKRRGAMPLEGLRVLPQQLVGLAVQSGVVELPLRHHDLVAVIAVDVDHADAGDHRAL